MGLDERTLVEKSVAIRESDGEYQVWFDLPPQYFPVGVPMPMDEAISYREMFKRALDRLVKNAGS